MNKESMEMLRAAGVDVQTALNRFCGNDSLYAKYLKKFFDDPNYREAGAALAASDWEEMLHAAHTLKGVAGNLGLDRLFETSGRIVAALRAGEHDAAAAAYAVLRGQYEELSRAVEQMRERGLL
ncbi:MAG: Hpt domain-containing protein [Eubacteriales bacterium]|nr:Hpt domain-containing protein [Eubacteriales bacterium]